MATTEKIGFEGEAPHNGVATVSNGYASLEWSAVGAIDRGWLKHNDPGPGSYNAVISGKDVGYSAGQAVEGGGTSYHSTISSEGTFSLKGGNFAGNNDTPETLVFEAYRHDHRVGLETFQIDSSGETIHLNHHFQNVDAIVMTTDTDIGGTGGEFAFDNLKVVLVSSGPSAVDAMHGHDAIMHGADAFTGMLC